MMLTESKKLIDNTYLVERIQEAKGRIESADSPVEKTRIQRADTLSEMLEADIWLASEVHQPIRAYKIRGAYNFVASLMKSEREKGVVTASAGNHAQGVALSCRSLGIENKIYMPETTPIFKQQRVKELGGETTEVRLVGRTFDECAREATAESARTRAVFVPPFDDTKVIAGQGTWGLEVRELLPHIDAVLFPVGGMGLLSGAGVALSNKDYFIDIIGVEPEGAPSLTYALQNNKAAPLEESIDTFVDGAAVGQVGKLPFLFARHIIDRVVTVSNYEARVATTSLRETQHPDLQVELAGSLAVAGLLRDQDRIKGKTVVCMLTGGNLGQERYESEVKVNNPADLIAI